MSSASYQIIRNAITQKKQVVATYDGFVREMCPHCIGLNKDGGEQALFFQFGGGSKSGLPPGGAWRCIKVDQLSGVSPKDGPWHTGATQHSKPPTCVKQVDVEVAH